MDVFVNILDASSSRSFFDLVSDALNSTTSNPNSLHTNDTVVVLPTITKTITKLVHH